MEITDFFVISGMVVAVSPLLMGTAELFLASIWYIGYRIKQITGIVQ